MAPQTQLDGLEHYPKRTFRNRLYLMQSTGAVSVTVPVERRGGRPRPQDQTFRVLGEPGRKSWQAIKSAYGRAPYFEEMADELEALFLRGPESLGHWNRATIDWAAQWLGVKVPLDVTPEAHVVCDHGVSMLDWQQSLQVQGSRWAHVWEDRHPKIPFTQLSILDLLLHLGPEAAGWIKPIPQSESRRPR